MSKRKRGLSTAGPPAGFQELLTQCPRSTSARASGERLAEMTGAILRSPRAGYFVIHRHADGCEAFELEASAVRDFELLFRDSAGRSTYRIAVAEGCPLRLLARAENPAVGADRPRADLGTPGGADLALAAWESAPWRSREGSPAEAETRPPDSTGPVSPDLPSPQPAWTQATPAGPIPAHYQPQYSHPGYAGTPYGYGGAPAVSPGAFASPPAGSYPDQGWPAPHMAYGYQSFPGQPAYPGHDPRAGAFPQSHGSPSGQYGPNPTGPQPQDPHGFQSRYDPAHTAQPNAETRPLAPDEIADE